MGVCGNRQYLRLLLASLTLQDCANNSALRSRFFAADHFWLKPGFCSVVNVLGKSSSKIFFFCIQSSDC